ncbi:uncharacterized protein LOC110863398 [Folsomia candida]|uniref:uncharacterized protein LOC110863398 n=1 Tax=Folsomia candida TaxID=158441 RepID=UPI000B8F6EF2|nr:uncharacterized protein LOC110863398 [Folsomia candida]
MSSQLCLLCSQVFANDDDTIAIKSVKKIKIETLFKLFHPNYEPSHQPQFDNEEMCDFCQDCYPLFNTIEEIKGQIILLEEEMGTKVEKIRAIMFDTSSQLKNKRGEKFSQIRNIILRVTGEEAEEETEQQDGTNFIIPDNVQVKMERDEVDNVDPLDDQFFAGDDYNPFSQQNVVKTEDKNFNEDDDADYPHPGLRSPRDA